MRESSISFPHRTGEKASFTTLLKSTADRFEQRLKEYDHEYTREDFFVRGEWDSAIFEFNRSVVRRPHLWVKTKR